MSRARSPSRSLSAALRAPAEALAAMVAVSAAFWLVGFVGLALGGLFVLTPAVRPWTLVTSVYAHAGPAHLLANAVVVGVVGPAVAYGTTRLRFHAFFVSTGAVAGLAQVWLAGLVGPAAGVLGASGAAFALVGYVLAANPASAAAFDRLRLPPRAVAAAVAGVALVVTLLWSAPGSALVAHFTGAALGLVAGRARLLGV
ncbi:hypothetical protein K933_13414 [Candidatus Halobonum tyrrellensis G22]|uniref:Peptidase S54 rhomboid domain-containing protein n=2 Tax=Candidatus Halobonum TaxID=1431544 RepID=V4HA43_9EURY|nr:hypothetical protein K933_13414 [Candidatus Halobonum tyrrellensis G22]